MKFTDAVIRQLKADPERRKEYPDSLLEALYLIVQPSGHKSWGVRYRVSGRTVKYTLGSLATIGLSKARELARESLRDVQAGKDPHALKLAKRVRAHVAEGEPDATFKGQAIDFIDNYARRKTGEDGHPRNRSWPEVARLLGLKPDPKDSEKLMIVSGGLVERWGNRLLSDITKDDVRLWLGVIEKRGGGVSGNRTLAALKKLFNRAKELDRVKQSPCVGIPMPEEEVERDRWLNDDEIRWFWRACDNVTEPFGSMYKLLLLLGQRRGEVSGMRESEINYSTRTWTIPKERAKNGVAHDVPLTNAVLKILRGIPRVDGDAGLIFSTTGKTAISGWSKAKRQLDKAMLEAANADGVKSIQAWRIHDLRRTAVSGMASLEVPVAVAEKCVNHLSGTFKGIVAVYQKHDFAAEKRDALGKWSARVSALIAPRRDRRVRADKALTVTKLAA